MELKSVSRCVYLMLSLVSGCVPFTQRTRITPEAGQSREATASWLLPGARDSAWMEVFVPAGIRTVRAAVVFIDREFDRYMYDDRDWRTMCARAACALLRLGLPNKDAAPPDSQRVRNAGIGGDSAVFAALRIGAERTGHPELQHVGMVFFGLSASGNFGLTFAGLHPERTIGFVRYHSHLRGLRVDTAALARIPSLTIIGTNDAPDIAEDSRALWRALRARDAPAAYVRHVGQPHVSIDGLVEAGRAMRPWIAAIIDRRTSAESSALTPVQIERGWLMQDSTAAVTQSASSGAPEQVSWLPDIGTAFAVRQLRGMCTAIDLRDATSVLGRGTRLESEDTTVCHYTVAEPRRDLWLSATSHPSDSAAVAWLAQAKRATPLMKLGAAANLLIESRANCSTVGVARSVWTFFVSACGAGLGAASDSVRLRPLAKQLIGEP